jgi:hypothetical protein
MTFVALLPIAACRSSVCPTIACAPQIAISYAMKKASPYQLAVSVRGMDFSAACPNALAEVGTPVGVGITSCDQNGFVVSGVDLGHGDNSTVDLSVSFDGNAAMQVQATLQYIANSRDCDLVCFDHTGTL